MGFLDAMGSAWNDMEADPMKKAQFQQVMLNLAQADPMQSMMANIGGAIQRSQAYIMQMRELQRQQDMEKQKLDLAKRGVDIQQQEANANTEYRKGTIEIGKEQNRQDRRTRIAANVQGRLNRKTDLEVARIGAKSSKDVAKIREDGEDKRLPASQVQLMDMAAEKIMLAQGTGPEAEKAKAWLKAFSIRTPTPGAAYGMRIDDPSIQQPTQEDIAQRNFDYLTNTGGATGGWEDSYKVGDEIKLKAGPVKVVRVTATHYVVEDGKGNSGQIKKTEVGAK